MHYLYQHVQKTHPAIAIDVENAIGAVVIDFLIRGGLSHL